MYLTLVIGSTGQGKTTFVKKTIGDKPCYIFDVNNEYEFSEDIEDEQARDTELAKRLDAVAGRVLKKI